MRFTETFSLRKSLRWGGGSFPNLPAASHFSIEDCVVKTEKLCEKKKANQLKIVFASFRGHLAGYGGCYSLGIDGSGLCILIGALLLYTFVMSGAVLWTSCVNALSK